MNVVAKKKFSQNFLQDKNIIKKIVALLDIEENLEEDDIIYEIGSGLGALTNEILKYKFNKFTAIEKDPEMVKSFQSINDDRFFIEERDATKYDFSKDFLNHGNLNKKCKIIGNLPYNVSSKIMLNLILNQKYISDAVFMVQKDFAQKLFCKRREDSYGRIALLMQIFFDKVSSFDVSPECFYPKPRVISTVLKVKSKNIINIDEKSLIEFITQCFSNRRKKLPNGKRIDEMDIDQVLKYFNSL